MFSQSVIVINQQVTHGKVELRAQKTVNGVEMGVLSDGTAILSERGLARMCGVSQAVINEIGNQWNDVPQKDRVAKIKALLAAQGYEAPTAFVPIMVNSTMQRCYPTEICLAVLGYYAVYAGANCQPVAMERFLRLGGSKLRELVYTEIGYGPGMDPRSSEGRNLQRLWERFDPAIDRIPVGFWTVFYEAYRLIEKLVRSGVPIDEHTIPDISLGRRWSQYWEANHLERQYGERQQFPHYYPKSYAQAKSNPQEAWCYPEKALSEFVRWLRVEYIGNGQLATYLNGKVQKQQIGAGVAQQVLGAVMPKLVGGKA